VERRVALWWADRARLCLDRVAQDAPHLRRADHAIYVTWGFLQRRYPSRVRNAAATSNVTLSHVSPNVL
jgi:hypothetical protein